MHLGGVNYTGKDYKLGVFSVGISTGNRKPG